MRARWRHAYLRFLPLASLAALCALAATACGTSTTRTVITLPTATVANIAVTTDFASYRSAQAIGVTVRNVSATPVYATDTHSACTIITLEEFAGGQWIPVMPCQSGAAVHVLLVAARSVVPYSLAPGNAASNPNEWASGTYRVALLYGVRADGADATSHTVYSAGFSIAA